MTGAAERILDLALEEVLGGKSPPDLTLRIMAAARTEDEGAPRVDARMRRRWGRWRLVAVAASVLLIVGGVLLLLPRRTDDPVFVATSTATLLTLVDGQEQRRDTFSAGDTVIVPGPEDATLSLASGQTLSLEAPAALRFATEGGGVALRVLAGTVRTVNESAEALALTGPQCEVVLDADSETLIDVLVDPWQTPEAFVRSIRVADVGSDEVAGTVVFAVESGRATFVRPKNRLGLGADEFVVLWPDGELELAPLPAARARWMLDTLLSKARVSTSDVVGEASDRMQAAKGADAAVTSLTQRLREQPLGWQWIRPYLHRLPADPQRNDAKRRLLQVLLDDVHPRTLALYLEVLASDPGVLDLDSTLVLAEGGLAAAEERLRDILGEPGAARRANNVYPALYFALRGDDVGRTTFEAAMENESLPSWNKPAYYAAVAGLELLDDASAWSRMIERLEARVEAAADESQLPGLQTEVLTATYFHRLVVAGVQVPVSHTRGRVLRWERAYAEQADTLEKIRAVIESIRDTGR